MKSVNCFCICYTLFKPDFMLSLQLYIFNPNDHCFKTKDLCNTYVTLDPKTSLKSLEYISSNSQKYIVGVKIIDFSFIQKSLGY